MSAVGEIPSPIAFVEGELGLGLVSSKADKIREQRRARRAKNIEKHRDYQRAWCAANKDKRAKYVATAREKYRETNRARMRSPERRAYENAYRERRFASDPDYKLRFNLRRRLNAAIRAHIGGKTKRSLEFLGCSIPSFRLYLESKFEEGMTWENYGPVWHIDHIIPLALFDLTKPDHQDRAFHFSNLQPLMAADNLAKGDKYPWQ